MQTTALSIELSVMVMDTLSQQLSPRQILGKVKNLLSGHTDQVGRYNNCEIKHQKNLGRDMHVKAYQLNYENSSLQFELIRFNPRGSWEVKGFQFV